MAFTEFTCRSGGSNLYAGTLDGSAEASTTPLVTYASGSWVQSTRVFTVASGNPVTDGVQVGQWVSVYPDGTSPNAVYGGKISAVTSTTITIDSTSIWGTAPTDGTSNRTLVVGGAFAGPSGSNGFPFTVDFSTAVNTPGTDFVRVNFKNDQIYSSTAAWSASTANPFNNWWGYTSTFGDGGFAKVEGPTTGSSYTLLTFNNQHTLRNFEVYNNGASGSSNMVSSTQSGNRFESCIFHDSRGQLLSANASAVLGCSFYRGYAAGIGSIASGSSFDQCFFSSPLSTDHPASYLLSLSTNGTVSNSVFHDATGSNGVLFNSQSSGRITNCSFHGIGRDGIVSSGHCSLAFNCVFDTIGGYGVNRRIRVIKCAFRNCTSGTVLDAVENTDPITLTADPFVNSATGDFNLNNDAGGGALLRGAGFNFLLQSDPSYGTSTVTYLDMGGVQHQDTGGGGGALLIPRTQQGGYNA